MASLLEEVKKNIKAVVVSSPGEMRLEKLGPEYAAFIGERLPYRKLGYRSLEEFLLAIPEMVQVNGKGFGAIITAVSNSKSDHIQKMVKEQKKCLYKPFGNSRYRFTGNKEVDFSKTQTKTPIQNQEIPVDNGETIEPKINPEIAKDVENAVNTTKEDKNDNTEPKPKPKVDDTPLSREEQAAYTNELTDFLLKFASPSEVMLLGESVKTPPLSTRIKRGNLYKLTISELYSPKNFFYHLENERDNLLELTMIMNDCYRSINESEFRIPPLDIRIKQYCAVRFKNVWLRAMTLSEVINDRIDVELIDSGCRANLSVKLVKFLFRVFACTPAQGIRACLSYITPKDGKWSTEAIDHFVHCAAYKTLYAHIEEIDEEKAMTSVVLADMSSYPFFDINGSLVDKGFAVYMTD